MEPNNVEYLRQLEALVRTLENENKILRAALKNSNALLKIHWLKHPRTSIYAVVILLIGLLRTMLRLNPSRIRLHLSPRSNCFELALQVAQISMHVDGKVVTGRGKHMCLCVPMSGVMAFVKCRLFVAMNVIIGPLSRSQMSSCVNNFMQEAGEPLRLKYTKATYGPHAQNLRHVLNAIEGNMVAGYADGGDEPDKHLQLVPGAVEDTTAFLN